MANNSRNNDETRRAAAQSASLLNARNAACRGAQAGGANNAGRRGSHARQEQPDSARRDSGRKGDAGRSSKQPERGSQQSTVGFIKRNSTYILSVVGVVAIAVLMIVFIRACAPEEAPVVDNGSDVHVTPYDWAKLDTTGDRYAYVVDGKVKSKLGIDVSDNQHWIDWSAVAADGIDFAIVRLGYRGATEGELYTDGYYEANVDGAHDAGLEVGVYFFSQASTVDEAIEEADFVIAQLGGRKLEYPIAFDSEIVQVGDQEARTANLTGDEMTDIAEAFCKRVEQAGYKSMVYGNKYDVSRYSYERMNEYNLWWAEYETVVPSVQVDMLVWQYSNGGSVDGIETAVDMNIDLSHVLD